MNIKTLITALCVLVLLNFIPVALFFFVPFKWMAFLVLEAIFLCVLYIFLVFIKATEADEKMMTEWIMELVAEGSKKDGESILQNN